MNLLVQFLLRLSFGLAAGMTITSARQVTSGYFRNHLYVVLGLTTLASMVSYSVAPEVFWFAASAAGASYVGSVSWLYEKSRAGKLALLAVVQLSLTAMLVHDFSDAANQLGNSPYSERYFPADRGEITTHEQAIELTENVLALRNGSLLGSLLSLVATCSSGLLLGLTMAAMLLGHWYLNSPTMELVPLRRLILAMGGAVALQAIVSSLGLWGELSYANTFSTQWMWFVVLRWSFGLVGVAALAWMAWETLKVPNTQSATGILYVAVIGTFVGETMALLLSAESMFPL